MSRIRRDPRLRWSTVPLAVLTWMAGACGPAGPREVALGEDQCAYCRMEVTDAKHATQAVTATGRLHVFDSVECMASFVREAQAAGEPVRVAWVRDAVAGGAWVRAEDAGFLLDASLRGPMGRAAAFGSPEAAAMAQRRLGGAPVSWRALLADSAGIASHASH